MATADKQIASVSFRGVQVLALDSEGYPAASGTSAYNGVSVLGAKALTLTRPERQRVVATGDDSVLAQFDLPAKEGVSGELRTGAFDIIAEELLTGISSQTLGELIALDGGTNLSDLPDVCLVAWRAARDMDGLSHYQGLIIPSAKISPMGGEWTEDSVEERTFSITPTLVGTYPWGASIDSGEDYDKLQLMEITARYIPRLTAFIADGTETEFTIDEVPSTDKVTVFVDGTEQSSGITLATTSVTFDSAPTSGAKIVVISEVESV